MKKVFVINVLFMVLLSFASKCFANEADQYIKKYESAKPADFQLVHNLDPYQVEDYYKYAWSPYPLFRTSIDLYFKNIKIVPGYYILTPRMVKGKDYVFFKQNGKVVYIIPVCGVSLVTPKFYKQVTPQPKRNVFGKIYYHSRRTFYKIFRKGKKQDPPPSYIEASTIDNTYFRIDLYLATKCYSMYFKKVPD